MGYTPTITVYRHPNESEYILMRFAPWKEHDNFSLAWGPLLHIPSDDMRSRGLDTCLEDLQMYSAREGTDDGSVKEDRALQSFSHVAVFLKPGPVLDVEPTSAFLRSSHPVPRVTIPLPCSNETFFHVINDVLDKCSIPKQKNR